jgi:hypothetical protein
MRSESERNESVKHMMELTGSPYDPNNEESRKRFDDMIKSYEEFEKMMDKYSIQKTLIERANLDVV